MGYTTGYQSVSRGPLLVLVYIISDVVPNVDRAG